MHVCVMLYAYRKKGSYEAELYSNFSKCRMSTPFSAGGILSRLKRKILAKKFHLLSRCLPYKNTIFLLNNPTKILIHLLKDASFRSKD